VTPRRSFTRCALDEIANQLEDSAPPAADRAEELRTLLLTANTPRELVEIANDWIARALAERIVDMMIERSIVAAAE
jgi:hypothetical protein